MYFVLLLSGSSTRIRTSGRKRALNTQHDDPSNADCGILRHMFSTIVSNLALASQSTEHSSPSMPPTANLPSSLSPKRSLDNGNDDDDNIEFSTSIVYIRLKYIPLSCFSAEPTVLPKAKRAKTSSAAE